MPAECCKDCRFFLQSDYEDDEAGYCRRYPPAISQAMPSSDFPIVEWDDWCGEWKPKPEPEQ